MEITINFIRNSFEKYNKKYFNDRLVTPAFRINNSTRLLGTCARRCRCHSLIYIITISRRYDRTAYDYDNTIIHEMIHLYIFQNNIKDTSSHGRVFNSIAERINIDGWNIQAKSKAPTNFLLTSKDKNKSFNVFLIHETKDKNLIFVVSKPNINYFKSWCIKQHKDFHHVISNDVNTFGRFPICRTSIRGRYITDIESKRIIGE